MNLFGHSWFQLPSLPFSVYWKGFIISLYSLRKNATTPKHTLHNKDIIYKGEFDMYDLTDVSVVIMPTLSMAKKMVDAHLKSHYALIGEVPAHVLNRGIKNYMRNHENPDKNYHHAEAFRIAYTTLCQDANFLADVDGTLYGYTDDMCEMD